MLLLFLLALANGDTVNDKAWEHFGLLNELRAEGFTCPNGASYAANPEPLKFDCRLWKASKLHSEDMATQGYFSHTSLDGRSPWDRARDQGISANGENIAAGRSSASGTLQQWKDSDGHCRNMMNPNFHVFAIGYFYESSSRYRYYWTQMFKSSDVSDLDTSCYPDFETTTLPATETETTSSSTDTTTTVTTESSTTATSTETGSTTTPVTSTQTDAASGTATGTGTGTGTGTATGTLSETTTGSSTGTDTAATGTGTSTTNSGTSLPSTETTLSSSLSTSISTSARSSASGTSTTSVAVASSEISQSSTSILAFSDTTQPIEETATTVTTVTTTAALESIQGKLVLEVSDPEGFLAASTELQGPLKSFLSELLQIDMNRITIFSVSLARRLSQARRLRRLMANLAVDYGVQIEEEKVDDVVTQMASGNATRMNALQESLQEDLAEMNITVAVVDVQVTSLRIDQNDSDTMAAILPALFIAMGVVCAICLCGCVAIACLRKKPKLPSDLPTIHGHLDGGQKCRSNGTMASVESEYVVSHL